MIEGIKISLTLTHRVEEQGVILGFIKPAEPTQNAFIGRFNRTYRTKTLSFYLFRALNEIQEITERWLREYNQERPHETLNNLTPEEYRLLTKNNAPRRSVELKQVCLQSATSISVNVYPRTL